MKASDVAALINSGWLLIKGLDDQSKAAVGLRPGTWVAIEGPYGAFTHHARVRDGVALFATGVGITPVRALLEDLPAGVDVVVVTSAQAPAEIAEILDRCAVARVLSGGWFDPWAVPGGFDPSGYVKGWGSAVPDGGAARPAMTTTVGALSSAYRQLTGQIRQRRISIKQPCGNSNHLITVPIPAHGSIGTGSRWPTVPGEAAVLDDQIGVTRLASRRGSPAATARPEERGVAEIVLGQETAA